MGLKVIWNSFLLFFVVVSSWFVVAWLLGSIFVSKTLSLLSSSSSLSLFSIYLRYKMMMMIESGYLLNRKLTKKTTLSYLAGSPVYLLCSVLCGYNDTMVVALVVVPISYYYSLSSVSISIYTLKGNQICILYSRQWGRRSHGESCRRNSISNNAI